MEKSRDLCGYYWNCHEQHAQHLCGYYGIVMSNMRSNYVKVNTSIDKPILFCVTDRSAL